MVIQRKTGWVKRFGLNVFAHLSSQWPHVRGKYVSGWKNTVNTFKLDLKTCIFPFLIWLHLLATQTSLPAIVIEPCAWLALHECKYKLSWNVVTLIFVGLAKPTRNINDYFNPYGCVEQTCPSRLTGKVFHTLTFCLMT